MNSRAEKDHNMTSRIALLGANTFMKTRLADILRQGDFSVDLYDSNTIPSLLDERLYTYHMVIASADLAAGWDEDAMINSSMAARGFLVFEDQEHAWDKEPSFLIHTGMSPEEIIAKVNGVLFLNSNMRKTPRVKFNQRVEYGYEGNHCQSTLQDISESGVFISTLAPPPVGTKISLHFSLPGGRDIAVDGYVVYCIAYNLERNIISHPSSRTKKIIGLPGMGVVFDNISEEDRTAIRAFIKNNL